MKLTFLFLFLGLQGLSAQIIQYEGCVQLKLNNNSDNINHQLLLAMMPDSLHERRILVVHKQRGYQISKPSSQSPSIDKEGGYKWFDYKAGFSYSHRNGQQRQPSLALTATNERKKICGYDCKLYYHPFEHQGQKDSIFFLITDQLPDKLSPTGILSNTQGIKGAVLAERCGSYRWEAVSVTPCAKISKKLFDWSLHPQNVSSEQLKKYLSCPF